MDPVSDLEKISFFKELVDSFPRNHPLKRYRGDVYFEIRNLDKLFSTMKQEGWTPDFVNKKIDEYIASLPGRDEYICKRATKEFKKGDIRTDQIKEETEKTEKLRAAVNEFDHFQELMRRKNRYDFDDMINWVIRAFEENPALLARYQEQYLYILVDEYQDTSGTQNQLVELLINYWEKPNVFVVGDDDQSIYRFQGANVANMLSFQKSFSEELLTLVLTNNYRSTQPILDISKNLIDRNSERLVTQIPGLSKDLLSSNIALREMLHQPVIREYGTPHEEMIDTALRVEKLLIQGVNPGRIGIIYKENKYGLELANYFQIRNLPVYSKRKINILELALARKILLLLKYLAAEHDIPYGGDEMLFEILHFDWFSIPAIEIAKLSVEVAERGFGDNKTSLRRLLFEKSTTPPRDLFSKNIHDGMKAAGVILESLIAAVPNTTLQQLFERIIREAGVLQRIMVSPDKIWLLQVLTGLFDFIKEETGRNPFLSLQGLVNIIELMEKENLALPLTQVSGSEKGVNLMTAHGSKGLEFEYIFIVGANASLWEKRESQAGVSNYPIPS